MITNFEGEFRFLSNFYPCEVTYEGIIYPSTEHAYQAAKTLDVSEREEIATLPTPGKAKRAGRELAKRPDWNSVKIPIMLELLRRKFSMACLKTMLLATGEHPLVEGNPWGDTFWGQCPVGTGQNMLGKLLMVVRNEARYL